MKPKVVELTLQQQWDRCLLHGCFEFSNCRVFHVVHAFESATQVKLGAVDPKLKRIPELWDMKVPLSRWVVLCLPKLAKILQDTDKDDVFRRAEILRRLKTSSMDTKRTSGDSVTKERSAQLKEVRISEGSNRIMHRALNAKYASYRRSNQWNVCK